VASEPFLQRRREVLRLAAETAIRLPLRDGLWFTDDLETNLYYAMHLFAAALDESVELSADRELCLGMASEMILRFLLEQDRDMGSFGYGHWPRQPTPEGSKTVDVDPSIIEMAGCVLIFFQQRYKAFFSEELQDEIKLSVHHVFQSKMYLNIPNSGKYEEARWRILQLMLGWLYEDKFLLEASHSRMQELLKQFRTIGTREYGSLPWMWHWIQTVTFAWEIVGVPAVRDTMTEMLELLWKERALFYLRGAWIGPHSHFSKLDVPQDRNVLFDYVMFGDFRLPAKIERLESAGLTTYEAPFSVMRHVQPKAGEGGGEELKRLVPGPVVLFSKKPDIRYHCYTYRTGQYAVGGMYEYTKEKDNAQHRWDISFPIDRCEGANQAFFRRSGNEGMEADGRSYACCEILLDRNVAVAVYPACPDGCTGKIVGCLPSGEWVQQHKSLFGKLGDCYLAVYLSNEYEVVEKESYLSVVSSGDTCAVVMEVVTVAEAAEQKIPDLSVFSEKMRMRLPKFSSDRQQVETEYISFKGRRLLLQADAIVQEDSWLNEVVRKVNGLTLYLDDYVLGMGHL
jgi:hypothetical protein